MKQIATFRMKVISATTAHTLSKGEKKKYVYGSVAVQSPKLKDYIGKEVMVRIFEE
jgi:hypothetical protein